MDEMNRIRIYGMLREVKDVAMQCSMTNSMRRCAPVLADMYNQCLKALAADSTDQLLSTLFKELPRDTVLLDEVGASAALLSRYVKPGRHTTGFETGHEDEAEEDEDDR